MPTFFPNGLVPIVLKDDSLSLWMLAMNEKLKCSDLTIDLLIPSGPDQVKRTVLQRLNEMECEIEIRTLSWSSRALTAKATW